MTWLSHLFSGIGTSGSGSRLNTFRVQPLKHLHKAPPGGVIQHFGLPKTIDTHTSNVFIKLSELETPSPADKVENSVAAAVAESVAESAAGAVTGAPVAVEAVSCVNVSFKTR
jgi:hypothetical protein